MHSLPFLRSRGFQWSLALALSAASVFAAGLAAGCGREIVIGGSDPSDPNAPSKPQGAGGGGLYGVRRNGGGAAFVRIEPATGVVTEIAPSIPGEGFTPPVYATIDAARRHYVYENTDYQNGGQRLVTLDLDTGAVLSDVPFDAFSQLSNLGVEAATGDIMLVLSDDNGSHLMRVDPVAGTSGEQVTVQTFGLGPAAFDGEETYYSLLGGSLTTVDVNGGGQTTKPVSSPYSLGSVQLDESLGELVAFGRSEDLTSRLVTVDLATGKATALPVMPHVNHALEGNATYDPATHRFFFTGGPDVWEGVSYWVEGDQIFTVDATTGQLLGTSPTVATNDPVYGIQFAP